MRFHPKYTKSQLNAIFTSLFQSKDNIISYQRKLSSRHSGVLVSQRLFQSLYVKFSNFRRLLIVFFFFMTTNNNCPQSVNLLIITVCDLLNVTTQVLDFFYFLFLLRNPKTEPLKCISINHVR